MFTALMQGTRHCHFGQRSVYRVHRHPHVVTNTFKHPDSSPLRPICQRSRRIMCDAPGKGWVV